MLYTGTDTKNRFRVIEQVTIEYIQNIAHRYFLLQVIGNVNQILQNPLIVSSLT